MKRLALFVGLLGAAMIPHECGAQIYNDPFAEYFERSIMIFPGGGNANDTNAALHTIDPWPPYARNTRIPDVGQRAVQGVRNMYTKPNPFFGTSQNAGSSANSGGSTVGGTNINIGGGGADSSSSGGGGFAVGGVAGGLQPVQAVPSGY